MHFQRLVSAVFLCLAVTLFASLGLAAPSTTDDRNAGTQGTDANVP
ncbi:MAG: hypothetical protein WC602_04945 [archaeon]